MRNPARQLVNVVVSPDRANWKYKVGEPVEFKVTVLQNDFPLDNITLNYQVEQERMGASKKGEITLKKRNRNDQWRNP